MTALPLSHPKSAQEQALARPACAMPDALAVLRDTTAALHARLDSQLPIAQDGAGSEAYAQHVALIGDWLAEIDRLPIAPQAWPQGWSDAQHGRRARIESDLAGLPVAVSAGPLAPVIPHTASIPEATDHAGFAWGVAYVVEGSQLGGQMLYRRLREALAPHPLQYFRGDGTTGGWPRFTAVLRAAVTDAATLSAASAGALWAFRSLAERFERAGAVA